jgi:hypothetical protein
MKTVIRSTLFLFLFFVSAYAKPELLNEKVIMESANIKINDMITELYSKTNTSIVVHLKEKLPDGNILNYEKNISATLQKPYVLIVFAGKEQKVDIVVSDDLKNVIDRNKILNTYIIPILGAEDKNSLEAKYSAAVLNGVAEMADEIAESKGIKLNSSIGSESKNFIQGLRVVFYGIIFGAIVIYAYMAYKRRRA